MDPNNKEPRRKKKMKNDTSHLVGRISDDTTGLLCKSLLREVSVLKQPSAGTVLLIMDYAFLP